MKKRDLFWVYKIVEFFIILLIFLGVFFVNIVQFNTSYIQEEKEELPVFEKQIQWAIIPYLQTNNINQLKKYALSFQGEDIKFRIFDKDKKLLATSNSNDLSPMIKKNSKILKKRIPWKIYKNAIKHKKIQSVKEFKVENSNYYIEVTLLEEKVIEKIIKAQMNLIAIFAFCLIVLFIEFLNLTYQVRSSFNRFDDSVLKIADGDLNTVIEIPKLAILEELAISVRKMTQRLKRQIERLEMLEKYKNEFLQNVSHEIKTPITAINMALELQQDSENVEQNKECQNIVKYQVNAINKLVNDILVLSEIDIEKANNQKVFTKINLNNLVEKAINSFNTTQEINFYANQVLFVKGVEDLLQSAIQNLIVNAIRYSATPKIDITLATTGDTVEIHIKDYGIGIAKEYQEKIFEKFYRIDKARSRSKGGSGLGLAIVKDIVELHNGKISIESEKGKGAEFIIKLPNQA